MTIFRCPIVKFEPDFISEEDRKQWDQELDDEELDQKFSTEKVIPILTNVLEFLLAGDAHNGIYLKINKEKNNHTIQLHLMRYEVGVLIESVSIGSVKFSKIIANLRLNIDMEAIETDANGWMIIRAGQLFNKELNIPKNLALEFIMNGFRTVKVLKMSLGRSSIRETIFTNIFIFLLYKLKPKFSKDDDFIEWKDRKFSRIYKEAADEIIHEDINKVNMLASVLFNLTGNEMDGPLDIERDGMAVYHYAYQMMVAFELKDDVAKGVQFILTRPFFAEEEEEWTRK